MGRDKTSANTGVRSDLKKVLIITYYWPPAGGPGVHRTLRFAKHLPEVGWQPIVLTVEKGDYPALDPSLAKQIPEDCQVFTAPALEPFKLYRRITGRHHGGELPTFILNKNSKEGFANRFAKWIRANLFIPDARIGWISKATRKGLEIISQEDIDLIFSSSPPHTVQLIARKIAAKTSKPWIADFRDPWTEAFWAAEMGNPISKYINSWLKQSVLLKASAISADNDHLARMLFSNIKRKVGDFNVVRTGIQTLRLKPVKSERFTILFFGHLSVYQSPESLFRAIECLSPHIKQEVQVLFIGRIHSDIRMLIESFDHLQIEVRDYMPHDQLMDVAQRASLLFRPVVQSSYSENSVGAKTYDYLALRKPILVLLSGPDSRRESSISKRILEETQSGGLFDYADISGIAGFIKHYFELWQRKSYILLDNEHLLEPYDTRVSVGKLAALFERTLAHNQPIGSNHDT